MKRQSLVVLLSIPFLLMTGCDKQTSESISESKAVSIEESQSSEAISSSETISSSEVIEVPPYVDKDVKIYRTANVVDKTISLRFFKELPHVPYIDPIAYYKEFFNTDLVADIQKSSYKYTKTEDMYIGFDAEYDTFFAKNLEMFNTHPDFISSTGKVFLTEGEPVATEIKETTIDLSKYDIQIFEENGHAYVPFSLLGKFAGGLALYNVIYNGKDIYVIDYGNELGLGERTFNFYGAAFYDGFNDLTSLRDEDTVLYTYNELCFVFDNLRGYTTQLLFGDTRLLTLELDGLLEKHHPKIKEYLLSTDKVKYLQGFCTLFVGLSDGGHTGTLMSSSEINSATSNIEDVPEFAEIIDEYSNRSAKRAGKEVSFVLKKRDADLYPNYGGNLSFCYKYDEATKTAFINFDAFELDYEAWDDYYNGIGEVPVQTDTYAYIRSKLYQAKEDGAVNVVLDLTTNGGGDSWSLAGIVGLFNKGKAADYINDTFNDYIITENFLIDINLDGKYDEKDEEEANKFNFNVGVLTSTVAFSCGNYLPFMLKELGYKTLGEKSGGGSCAIQITASADGLPFVHSSYLSLCTSKGENVDGGVEVDLPLEYAPRSSLVYDVSDFYNFEKIASYLTTAYIN